MVTQGLFPCRCILHQVSGVCSFLSLRVSGICEAVFICEEDVQARFQASYTGRYFYSPETPESCQVFKRGRLLAALLKIEEKKISDTTI